MIVTSDNCRIEPFHRTQRKALQELQARASGPCLCLSVGRCRFMSTQGVAHELSGRTNLEHCRTRAIAYFVRKLRGRTSLGHCRRRMSWSVKSSVVRSSPRRGSEAVYGPKVALNVTPRWIALSHFTALSCTQERRDTKFPVRYRTSNAGIFASGRLSSGASLTGMLCCMEPSSISSLCGVAAALPPNARS